MKKKPENLLIVADSDHDANMLYAVGMFVPDPFIYLRLRGRSYMVMSDLEIDRARKNAPHCQVLSFNRYQEKLRKQGVRQPGYAHVILSILCQRRLRRVSVPGNFPLGLARELNRLHVKAAPIPKEFFPQR